MTAARQRSSQLIVLEGANGGPKERGVASNNRFDRALL